jgi:hypothetical protein
MRIKRPIVVALIAALSCAVSALAQEPRTLLHAYHTVVPLDARVTRSMVRAAVAFSATVPMWEYTVVSPLNDRQYSGTMIGRSPFFHGARTTAIPAVIVPIIITMSDGTVFNPAATDTTCSPAGTALSLVQNSPLFNSIDILMGSTDLGVAEYVDAFQRANFWTEVSPTGDRYHTMLSPVTTVSAIPVTVPSAYGATNSIAEYGGCGRTIGVMSYSWWNDYMLGTVMPSLVSSGVGPAVFPVFLFYNVVMNDEALNLGEDCCILGYHGAAGVAPQTYAVADFDTTGIFDGTKDISDMSHEIAEWMNDPLGNNPTPAWGGVGQVVGGCQNNLEVGDPLSGIFFPNITMPNGYTYNPQELAFFSWFYRQAPSIGVNGWYSDNDTFTSDAGLICE